jgi:signal transduction histidine kinase/CheY-like chemotaxis protein
MMESILHFKPELRVPIEPVLAVLAILGLAFVIVGEYEPGPLDRLQAHRLALTFYALSFAAWLIGSWKPRMGRWLVIVGLVGIVVLADAWLSIPGLLSLVVIPSALACALIGLHAGIITTLSATVLVLLPTRFAITGADLGTVVVALAPMWATLGIMGATHRRVHQLDDWLWEYFERVQGLLEESRDRKAELAQALDDLVHANRQMALMNDRLAALRLIAEQAERAKAAFVAKVSHEFRTPLNILRGMVDLIVEAPQVYGGAFPEKALDHLRVVYRNCRHLASMIEDVLNLSQAEAGRASLHRAWVDLVEVIDSAIEIVRPLMEEKGLGWQVAIPEDLPDVYCDRIRIRQVILNLLSNAARFTREGGVRLSVNHQDQYVVVSVSDTGPGLPPEHAERIFEPFSQGPGESWDAKGGSGLGLSISKQFVELHGGRMWLESELGIGTTFYVDLPVSGPIEHYARPGHQIKEEWIWVERKSRPRLPDSHYKSRVVICDETGDLYPAFSRHSDEIEFIDTQDLPRAIQELQSCPAQALILNTPSPNGLWPLIKGARQSVPDTPIIGCCCPPRMEHALKVGAMGYLTKPVARSDLKATIEAVGRPVKRVLVVDDDADTQELLRLFVQAIDDRIEVVVAESGAQSLHELRARPPDLMLLDLLLPDIDGWQVLDIKGQDEALRRIPTVIISAQDAREGPMMSEVLLAAMGEGLSLGKLLDCSTTLSTLLLQPG